MTPTQKTVLQAAIAKFRYLEDAANSLSSAVAAKGAKELEEEFHYELADCIDSTERI